MRTSKVLSGSLAAGGILALLMAFPHDAYSQLAGSGTITGSVTDPAGAVVPGADITIRNTDTGSEHKIGTTDVGIYTAVFLPPGHYEVEAGKAGFAKMKRREFV